MPHSLGVPAVSGQVPALIFSDTSAFQRKGSRLRLGVTARERRVAVAAPLRNANALNPVAYLLDDVDFFVADFGRFLILAGGILVVAGIVAVLLGRTNLPLGRLPGDIVFRGKHTTVYFPLATSIVVSVVLSVLLYVIGRFRR
jgi:hypothetical protein